MVKAAQRNGIAATPMKVELEGRDTGGAILATAQSLGCDLLVKGAYTQSRLRQMMFGGATRHLLTNATLPYAVSLANLGVSEAVRRNPGLRPGVNVAGGKVTHPAVAEGVGADHVPVEEALAGAGTKTTT